MIYTEAEHFIKESHNGVIRLGLGRIEELLERLGCPQKKLKFIHVAGTNGKGSVCAMTAEILKAAGSLFYILMKTGVILWCWKSAWAVVMMQPM